MKRAIIGIGIPASGKTTILKELAKQEGFAYVNRDDIRQEFTGDPRDHSREPEVGRLSYARMRQGLLERGGVIVDATNVKRRDRRETIELLREGGAEEIVAYWLDIPLEVALSRNAARDRVVPSEVIEGMYRRLALNPPTLEEGFDRIERITPDDVNPRPLP